MTPALDSQLVNTVDVDDELEDFTPLDAATVLELSKTRTPRNRRHKPALLASFAA